MTSKTFLVTGAAGFIGSHVSELLAARGHRVIGLDNYNDYYAPSRKESNVAEVTANSPAGSFHVVRGDVRDRALVNRLFEEYRFDGICHLAAMAGVRISVEDPHLYLDVNLVGTLNLLEAARYFGRPSFVFASTSSVYGATDRHPFIETDPADRPLAPYPASKRAAEILGFSYHHLHKLDFTALRFFTVYGPRGRPDMMAYKVLDSIYQGGSVPLYNGGRMHRDWTYVSDIAAGVVAALENPVGYEIINLGRGEPVLLADFVERVQQLAGRRANLVDEPMLEADIAFTYADIEKARRLLGYDPKVGVHEGTAQFFDWYERAVLAP